MSIKKDIFAPFASGLGAMRRAAMLLLVMMLTATTAWATDKTLSGSESYTANDGDVLTGSTSGTVTIANNAKITLSDVTITGGIVCDGSATITLVGTNSVTGATNKAGIQIGGSGTTLTIKGNGSLTANGGNQSAGIGLSRAWGVNATGGDILIEGGNITANGSVNGQWGAGIGTGVIYGNGSAKTAQIGNITIKGGSVKATGGSEANGIGTGYTYGGCTNTIGTVTIYVGIDKVDASSIRDFGSVVYKHDETDVTANKSDYFTITEDGNRRVIEPKDDTDYTITIANGIEHGTLTGAATAKYTEKVTITATPALGYRFSRLVVKDAQNNDVASTGNSFFMPKSNVTVSAVFEQGTHGTTEFAWGYYLGIYVTEATIYDGVTTVELQQGKKYFIGKDYQEGSEPGKGFYDSEFRPDEDPYAKGRDIPYSGGTGSFMGGGYGEFTLNGDAGYYDITMTDVGNGKWNVSILKTAGQMDVVPDQTYTGSAITPEPTVIAGSLNLTKGTDYVYSYENNENVGTAKVIASFLGTYAWLGNVEKEFTIVKATPTVNAPTAVENLIHNGSAQTLVNAGSTDFGTLLYSLDGQNYSADIPTGTDAGTYTIYYKVEGSDNWNAVAAQTIQATILPSTVIVNVTGNGTVTYNDKSAASGETFGVAAEKGTDVTLTLAPESGYAVSIAYGYTNNSGTTAIGLKLPINGSAATLTVPNDLKDGTYVNLTVTFVSALAGGADEASAVALTDATVTDLGGGWYKVDSDISFDHTLNLLGDTHLIIADGKTMTVNTASNRGIYSDYTLFVRGDGALSVTTTSSGIAVCVGNYVQTGATVTASGSYGIRCTDDFIAFNFTNDFTFSGGQLTATGNSGGIWADNDITLSCTNATDFIQASSYSSGYGAVKIAEGKALTDGTEASNGMNGYSGTLTNEQRTAIGGKTLHRAVTTSYVDARGTLHENVIAIPLDNTMTTLAAGWYVVNEDVNYTSMITLDGDVNLILGDGKTMTVTNTGTDVKDRAIYGDEKTLHIYGQSQGTGALTATAVGGESAIFLGISDDNAGSLLGIHGGVVSASTECASGVAISVQCATDAGGIVIDGGQVTASGKSYGIFCFSGHFDVIGGQVTATGTNGYGLGICDYGTNPGVLTLGYSKASDFVSTNSIYNYSGESSAGEVKIADGQTLVDDGGNIYTGTLTSEQITAIAGKTLRPVMGVTLTKDGDNISAVFDGTSTTTLSIPVDITVNSVTYNRTFTASKPSTVMLPFDYTCTGSEGGTFYKFVGVEKEGNTWVATMKATGDDANNQGTLTANTPYLFMPTGESLTFTGGATLNTTGGGNGMTADEGSHWTFKGTYEYMKWTTETGDPDYNAEREAEIGRAYGFAGVAKTGINVGDFVRVASGAKIRPMSCYLLWNNEPNSANARSFTRGAAATDEELPQRITVRLVGSNGETTGIGTIDTKTGEVSFDSEAWYTLDGVRLSGKPTKKGLYINNGKKIVIR